MCPSELFVAFDVPALRSSSSLLQSPFLAAKLSCNSALSLVPAARHRGRICSIEIEECVNGIDCRSAHDTEYSKGSSIQRLNECFESQSRCMMPRAVPDLLHLRQAHHAKIGTSTRRNARPLNVSCFTRKFRASLEALNQ